MVAGNQPTITPRRLKRRPVQSRGYAADVLLQGKIRRDWYALVTAKATITVILLLNALLLVGCSAQPESLWLDYRDRLQRVLQHTLPITSQPQGRELPKTTLDQAEADNNTDTFNLSLLEVHQGRVCGLDQLAAQRNNQLGKVMTASVQLHYELKLLALLPSCINEVQLSSGLRDKLIQLYAHKRADIIRVFQHFLHSDETLRAQLQGSLRGLGNQHISSTSDEQALRQLIELKQMIQQQDFVKASQLDIEATLAVLHRSMLLADLQHSLHVSLSSLRQLNNNLQQLPTEQLCRSDKQVRDNLMQQVFIGKLQQYLAQVTAASLHLEPLLETLYHQHPLQPVVQQRYQLRRLELQAALQQHIQFWQRWRQCQ